MSVILEQPEVSTSHDVISYKLEPKAMFAAFMDELQNDDLP